MALSSTPPRCFCQRPSTLDPSGHNVCEHKRCAYRSKPRGERRNPTPPASETRSRSAPDTGSPARGPGTPVTSRRLQYTHAQSPSSHSPASVAHPVTLHRQFGGAAAPTPVTPSHGRRTAVENAANGPTRVTPTCWCPGEPWAAYYKSQTKTNPGRELWRCSRRDSLCNFFQWADESPAPASSSQSLSSQSSGTVTYAQQYGGPGASPGGGAAMEVTVDAPTCFCPGEPPAMSRVSRTATNPDREFWSCKRPMSGQGDERRCKFFQWADAVVGEDKRGGKRPRSGESNESSAVAKKRPCSPQKLKFGLNDVGSLAAHFLPGDIPDGLKAQLAAMEGVQFASSPGSVRSKLGQSEAMQVSVQMSARIAMESAAAKFGVSVENTIPDRVLDAIGEYSRKEIRRAAAGGEIKEGLDEILPQKMCEKLMEFQWEGIHFALRRGGRALIGDDMGLGKTLQAIAVARIYRDDWPLVIICPSSLRLNWKDELLIWLGEDIDEEEINVVMNGADAKLPFKLVNIVSYDLAQKVSESKLAKCKFIICDESHYLKSREAKRTKFVIPFVRRCKRSLLLSGTPALSRPAELYPQVSALEPELFPNFKLFTERYCNAHHGRWGWDVSGSANLGELYKILNGSCLIRRKKEDVLTQLPAKQRGIVWVETKSQVMKEVRQARILLQDAVNALNAAQSEEDALTCRNAQRAAQTKLYKLSGEAKIDSVVAYVKDLLSSTDGKLLIFAHHKSVISDIDVFLRLKLKLKTIVIDGNTPQHLRQGLCKTFQTDASVRVAVLSITAAGVGLTLTAASQVIFAEIYWNPGSLLQAEDRAHRIGQKDCVMVKYLLAKETHDQAVWDMVRDKLLVVGNALTGAGVKMKVHQNDDRALDDGTNDKIKRFFGRNQREVVSDDDDNVPGSNPTGDGEVATVPTNRKIRGTNAGDDRIINLEDSDDEVFPVDLTPSPRSRTSLETRPTVHLDADLAFARRLQAEFDAEANLVNSHVATL